MSITTQLIEEREEERARTQFEENRHLFSDVRDLTGETDAEITVAEANAEWDEAFDFLF